MGRAVTLQAVSEEGLALRYSAPELQADKQVVTQAVGTTGRSLEFASEELQGDREVVVIAIKQDRSALTYASEKLRIDKDIWLYDGEKAPCADIDKLVEDTLDYFERM